jgi:hypothetical protein
LVASVGGPALVMLRARRHFLEGVGGVVHDNERRAADHEGAIDLPLHPAVPHHRLGGLSRRNRELTDCVPDNAAERQPPRGFILAANRKIPVQTS